MGCHPSHWRTHMFQRGRYTTNQLWTKLWIPNFQCVDQWEFQDPKTEVLYHIRPYFVGIFPYAGLIYGRYLQMRFLKWHLYWLRSLCLLQAVAVRSHSAYISIPFLPLHVTISGWCFGTLWNHGFFWLSIQLGMSSSQLTNSYFSPPTRFLLINMPGFRSRCEYLKIPIFLSDRAFFTRFLARKHSLCDYRWFITCIWYRLINLCLIHWNYDMYNYV